MIERKFIEQGYKTIEIERYLAKELSSAGFTKADIMKTPLVTRIALHVTRPGLAIGKKGMNIKKITETLEKDYGVENPQIEIAEIKEPSLNAQAMANRISFLIENGYSWRSVSYRALRDVARSGAQGVEIIVKGVITGKGQRKRIARMAKGYMKKIGEQARLVDYGLATAHPKQGAIGIKVWIVSKDTVFSDKVEIPVPEKAVEEDTIEVEATAEETETEETIEKEEKKEEKKEDKKEKKEPEKPVEEETTKKEEKEEKKEDKEEKEELEKPVEEEK